MTHSVLLRPLNLSTSIALLTILFGSQILCAQTTVTNITFSPAAPTASDTVSVRIDMMAPACAFVAQTAVTGSIIRTVIVLDGCVLGPPGTFPATVLTQFGPVPAGTYTYEISTRFGSFGPLEFETQRSLVISPAVAPIPVLDSTALAVLALLLAIVGVVFLRRA